MILNDCCVNHTLAKYAWLRLQIVTHKTYSTQPITFFTWVDALVKYLSAPRCFQGLQAVRHTQQCDSHGQPLNGKDQNCYSSFPYLHHDCMVRGVTPEAKFFKLKHWDVMSSSCAVGQSGRALAKSLHGEGDFQDCLSPASRDQGPSYRLSH